MPGIFGQLPVPLALGLLRLTTEGRPSRIDAVAVIHFALSHGVRILDTADVYALDDTELHYGERLAREAVESWRGPRDELRIITKAGLSRPKGRWMPNGRPAHLRKAVDGSLQALGVERLFLLQLHAHDSRVPFEETLGALAELQQAGKVEHLGLCNTSPGEIQQAQRHFTVAAVQNELSVLNRKSAADGTLAFAREHGIAFLAHRPLGGYAKVKRLLKNATLRALAERHGASPHEMALAALRTAGEHVIPLIGATRLPSVASSVKAAAMSLDVSDRTAVALHFPFETKENAAFPPLAASRAAATQHTAAHRALQPNQGPGSTPEVVLLMGIQGAGKSELVTEYVNHGYVRLNRDELGGKLDDLVPRMTAHLAAGRTRIVFDNTYPTRLSRAPVIAGARAHGVPARCRFLNTPLHEAYINIVLRMVSRYGVPLGPDQMKALRKTDPNLPPPQALMRFQACFEPPQLDEGFAVVDEIPFVRRVDPAHVNKGLLLDVDGTIRKTRSGELYPRHPDDVAILPGRKKILSPWVEAGYKLFFVSNQSGVASGRVSHEAVQATFYRTAELLGVPITEIAYCPHPAHPVGCFCRKPMPGLGVYLMQRHALSRDKLVMVGDMDSDAVFATAIGARYYDEKKFFGLHGPRPG